MFSPILLLVIIAARLVLDFDPKPYGLDKTATSHTTLQSGASNLPPSYFPSNICLWSWPIQRMNPRPVTTLNHVARIIAHLGYEYTEQTVFPTPTYHTYFPHIVLLYNPSHTTTLNPIKIFTAPLSEAPDRTQIVVEFPSMYLLVKHLIRSKLKLSHFWNALSLATILFLFAVYLKLAKAFWCLHYGHKDLYGPVCVYVTRRQQRSVTHQSKSRQRLEHAKHVENMKYFQSVFNHGLTIVTGYKARLADETRRNDEIARTLAIQTSLCADRANTISKLELERNLQEQRYQRRMADIDALDEWVLDRSALIRAKNRELDAQTDLINRLKHQIKETEAYYARHATYLGQDDFDMKMDDARRIQHGLEATIAKKDAIIDGLRAQTVSMTYEVNRVSTELLQTNCNQLQVDAIKEEMERMRVEIEQMRSAHKEDQLVIAKLTTENTSLVEKTLSDATKANSEIEQLRSTQKAAEQSIVMLKAESASLLEKAETGAMKNDLEIEQMRMGRQADEQTIATLRTESVSLVEKSERDDREISRLNTANAAQGEEIATMNAMLAEMCQIANTPSPVSEGVANATNIPSPSTSEGSANTVVEAGGPSLAQLLSEVDASRSEVMEVTPKENHVEQPSLALPHESAPSSTDLTNTLHGQTPFSWDFTNSSTQPFNAESCGMFGVPDIFSNLGSGLPIQSQAMDETPAFLGSAEDMWSAAMTLDFPQIPTTSATGGIPNPILDDVMAEVPTLSCAAEGNGITIVIQGPMQVGSDFAMTNSCQLFTTPTLAVPPIFDNTSSEPMEVEHYSSFNSSQPLTAPDSIHSPAVGNPLPTWLNNSPLDHIPSGPAAPNATPPCIETPIVRGLAAAAWAANPSGSRPIRKIKQGLRAAAPPPSITGPSPATEGTTTEVPDILVVNPNNTSPTASNNIAGDVVPDAPVVAGEMDVFRLTAKPLGRAQVVSHTAPPTAPVASTSEGKGPSNTPKKPTQPKPRGRSVLSAGIGGKLSVTTRK